ncbi:hypothetical protein ND747_29000, partial [Frankia sp. R82]
MDASASRPRPPADTTAPLHTTTRNDVDTPSAGSDPPGRGRPTGAPEPAPVASAPAGSSPSGSS